MKRKKSEVMEWGTGRKGGGNLELEGREKKRGKRKGRGRKETEVLLLLFKINH